MTIILIFIAFSVLTYVERKIYLHFRSEVISEWHKGRDHLKNLKRPIYGFYYRLYVDYRD